TAPSTCISVCGKPCAGMWISPPSDKEGELSLRRLRGCRLDLDGHRGGDLGVQADLDLVAAHAADRLLEMDRLAVDRLPGLALDLHGQVLCRDAAEQLALAAGPLTQADRELAQALGHPFRFGTRFGHALVVGPPQILGLAHGALARLNGQTARDEVVQ